MTNLNPRQERFVQEYLIDLNATQAAIRAGYTGKNADVQGPRLLGNVGVAAAIEARRSALTAEVGVTQAWVVERLRREAMGEGKDTSPSARVSALALLAKYVGGFSDKAEVEHKGNINVIIRTFGESDEPLPSMLQ
jgi:phage terminase small subunit